ncbi:MAG: DUF2971 domain-containing protein [Candidatus Pacebacteria bacterium]|nr:DUF2971 domain-containing protein [Candidatus Paceibacterota bacterium]
MGIKFYHYTSLENAEKILDSGTYRLGNINHTTDHTEGYYASISEMNDLKSVLSNEAYNRYFELKNETSVYRFFASMTIVHKPTDYHNPLWRMYGNKKCKMSEMAFGSGACVEFELPERQVSNCLISESLLSGYSVMAFSNSEIIISIKPIQYVYNGPSFKVSEFQISKNFTNSLNPNELNKYLKTLAWAGDYYYKSTNFSAENEIRLMVVYKHKELTPYNPEYCEIPISNIRIHKNEIFKKEKDIPKGSLRVVL